MTFNIQNVKQYTCRVDKREREGEGGERKEGNKACSSRAYVYDIAMHILRQTDALNVLTRQIQWERQYNTHTHTHSGDQWGKGGKLLQQCSCDDLN